MYVCQLANLAGLRIISTASPNNFDLVRSFGASSVVDYRAPDVVQQILHAAGLGGVDYAYDAISQGDSVKLASEVLKAKIGGLRRVVLVVPVPPDSLEPTVEYYSIGVMTVFNKPYEFLGVNIPVRFKKNSDAEADCLTCMCAGDTTGLRHCLGCEQGIESLAGDR